MIYILLALSVISILVFLALFVVAIIVGHEWTELSEYHNKEETK